MIKKTPFEVRWTEAEVGIVLDQIRGYPWPPVAQVPDGWAFGCDPTFLRALCDHWTNMYDWRAAMADLNRFPQDTSRVEDFDLHFLHVVGEAKGKRPLLLSHGWPGSHYEFWRTIEPFRRPGLGRFRSRNSLVAGLRFLVQALASDRTADYRATVQQAND